jgi:arylsulfatase A-like enzyme
MYGVGREPTDSYARRCVIARRLVERGVRFVQLFINGQIWDNHTGLATDLQAACDRTDRPIAALLGDLKQRGLFDSTLVVWGGEFGRLPIAQLPSDKDERKAGRDHNKNAFCTWMAGAGIKGGTTYGATDEIGMSAVEDRVSVPDWHATILHLLGLHHDQLYLELNGLKEKLTGVKEAKVVRGILA